MEPVLLGEMRAANIRREVISALIALSRSMILFINTKLEAFLEAGTERH